MVEDLWDNIYAKAILPRLFQQESVALGFHSTIDGIRLIKQGELETLLSSDIKLERELKSQKGRLPDEINSPVDLLLGLLWSMENGKALQLIIRSEEVFRWTLDRFGYDRLQLGGTSGNMAKFLVPLGFSKVLVYANPLTLELAELFPKASNLFCLVRDGDNYLLCHPVESAKQRGIFAIHWIMEYPTGLRVNLKRLSFETPRANRFIPTWNPINNRLILNEDFKKGFLEIADQFQHLVISGFHLLSERYPDDSIGPDYVKPIAEYLHLIRERHSHLRIHCEFASIASRLVRQSVVHEILPTVDSLGINEVEMATVLDDLGLRDLAKRFRTTGGANEAYEGLRIIMAETGIKRVQLHNLGYYLCIAKEGWSSPEKIRRSLAFSALLAVQRATSGQADGQNLKRFLSIPVSSTGLEQLKLLSDRKIVSPDGIGQQDDYIIAFLPTRIVEKPILTVGLGDLISASAFVAENMER